MLPASSASFPSFIVALHGLYSHMASSAQFAHHMCSPCLLTYAWVNQTIMWIIRLPKLSITATIMNPSSFTFASVLGSNFFPFQTLPFFHIPQPHAPSIFHPFHTKQGHYHRAPTASVCTPSTSSLPQGHVPTFTFFPNFKMREYFRAYQF